MSYKLTIIEKPAQLHAIVTGLNTKENVAGYLNDIYREIASEGSSRAFGYSKAIAYVDMNAEGDLMKFAETVAVNRALPVRVFSSVSDAEKWLLDKERGGPEPRPSADEDKQDR